MEQTKEYYAGLAQQALDAGRTDEAKTLIDHANSLADSNQATPENPEEDSKGFVGATVEAVAGVGIGAMTAIKEAGDTIDWAAEAIQNKLGDVVVYDDIETDAYKGYEDAGGVHLFNAFGKKIKWASGAGLQELKEANLYSMLKTGDQLDKITYDTSEAREDGVLTTAAGEMTAGVSQFLTGWVALGGVKAVGIAGGIAKGAAVDFTVFDEHEARLSDMAIEFGLENELTLYLASDKDDSVFEGKLKNAIEGAGIGLAVEGVVKLVKAVKAARNGNTEAAEELVKEGQEAVFKDPSEVQITDVDGTPIDMGNTKVTPKTPAQQLEELVGKSEEFVPATKEADVAEPTYFHGTQDLDFTEFRVEPQENFRQFGDGVYLAKDKVKAEGYAKDTGRTLEVKVEGKVASFDDYVRVRDSLDPSSYSGQKGQANAINAKLEAEGFSGLDAGEELVIFKAENARIQEPNLKADELDAVKVGYDVPKNPLRSDAPSEVTPEAVRAETEAVSQKKRAENKDFRDAETGKTTKQISWREQMETGKKLTERLARGIEEEDGVVGIVKFAKSLLQLPVPVKEWDSFSTAAANLQKQIEDQMLKLANSPAGKMNDPVVKAQLESLGEAVTYASAARGAAQSQGGRITQAAKNFKSRFGYDVNFDFDKDGIITAIRDAETGDIIRKGHKHFNDAWDILNEVNLNFMLSGMGTQLVNMLSNGMIALLHPLEMYIGATGRMVANAAKGNIKEATKSFALPNRQMIGLWKYRSIAAKYAAKSFRAGKNVLDEEGTITEVIGDSASDVAIGKGNATSLKEFGEGNAWDKFGNIVRLPSRALLAGDEFFKQLSFRAKAYGLAAEELMPKFGHLDAHSFDAMVESRVDAAFQLQRKSKNKADMIIQAGEDPRLVEITESAIQQARRNTFTNDLGGGGKSIQKIVSSNPWLRQIIPFIRTPINILKYPLKRTPLLHKFSREMTEKIAKGGAERDEAYAMLAMGTGMWIGAGVLASAKVEIDDGMGGKVSVYRYQGTWAGYTTARKQALKAAGGMSNSYITEDGEFVQYSRLDPISIFMGVAADVRDIYAAIGEDADSVDVAQASIMAIVNVFKDKSYTKGLSDAIKAFDEPEAFLGHWMNSKASSYVPSAVAQAKFDPLMREVRNPLDAIINRIPMLSKTLEPQFDPFGRPILATTGLLVKSKYSNDDIVSREILNLVPSLGELPDNKGGVDLTDAKYQMKNTAGETVSAYYRFNEILNESKLIAKLEKRIKSPKYQERLSAGIVTQDAVIGNTKEDALQSIVKKERDKAWKQLLKENEILDNQVEGLAKAAKNAGNATKQDDARDLLNGLF